jgi:hypothetical protein
MRNFNLDKTLKKCYKKIGSYSWLSSANIPRVVRGFFMVGQRPYQERKKQ